MKTLEEKQQMIAEFVGHESSHFPKHYHLHKINLPLTKLEDLKFNSSWDWLMSVVENIESMGFSTSTNTIGAQHQVTKFEIFSGGASVLHSIDKSKKQAIFNAVVKFIEWYNEN